MRGNPSSGVITRATDDATPSANNSGPSQLKYTNMPHDGEDEDMNYDEEINAPVNPTNTAATQPPSVAAPEMSSY